MTDIINLTAKRTNKNGDPKAENGITSVSKPTISYDGETITVPVIHTGFAPTGYTIKTVHLPVAGFYADNTGGCSPFTVNFDTSDTLYADDITMSYGDGGSATTGFSHEYTSAGLYDVSLTASGRLALADDTLLRHDYIEVLAPPVADFHAAATSGQSPANIGFYDDSTGADRWTWAFGDGATSGSQNPSHDYTTGTYSVILTTGNKYCSDSKTRTDYIVIEAPPPGQWVSKFNNTFWEPLYPGNYPYPGDSNTGYWDGEKWIQGTDSPFAEFQLVPIGNWYQNYRPAKMRVKGIIDGNEVYMWITMVSNNYYIAYNMSDSGGLVLDWSGDEDIKELDLGASAESITSIEFWEE